MHGQVRSDKWFCGKKWFRDVKMKVPEGRMIVARRFNAGVDRERLCVPWGRLKHNCVASVIGEK